MTGEMAQIYFVIKFPVKASFSTFPRCQNSRCRKRYETELAVYVATVYYKVKGQWKRYYQHSRQTLNYSVKYWGVTLNELARFF
jgi:hypothetical protein